MASGMLHGQRWPPEPQDSEQPPRAPSVGLPGGRRDEEGGGVL